MGKKSASLGLCCIVKNESNNIRDMLDSIYTLIDYFLIVDTGSDDNTKRIVSNFLIEKGLDGAILEHPFVNFEDARNFALNSIKDKCDYSFTIDGDEKLIIESGYDEDKIIDQLVKYDCGNVKVKYSGISFTRRSFWNNSKNFYYKYPVHEILNCDEKINEGSINGLYIDADNDKQFNAKYKYSYHAQLLEDYIFKGGLDPRCAFYLAQSYKDSGQYKESLKWYEIRAGIREGFGEEIYYSRYMVGNLKCELGYSLDDIINDYVRCFDLDDMRCEHIHKLIGLFEANSRYGSAVAMRSLLPKYTNPFPHKSLFIDEALYYDKI